MQFSKLYFVSVLSLIAGVQSASIKRTPLSERIRSVLAAGKNINEVISDAESQLPQDRNIEIADILASPANEARALLSVIGVDVSKFPVFPSDDAAAKRDIPSDEETKRLQLQYDLIKLYSTKRGMAEADLTELYKKALDAVSNGSSADAEAVASEIESVASVMESRGISAEALRSLASRLHQL